MQIVTIEPIPPRPRRSPAPRRNLRTPRVRRPNRSPLPVPRPPRANRVAVDADRSMESSSVARDLPLGLASLLILVLLFATSFWCLRLAANHLPSGDEWDRRLIRLQAQLR